MHQGCEKDVEITDVGVFVSQQATKGYSPPQTVPRINQTQMAGVEFKTRESRPEKEHRLDSGPCDLSHGARHGMVD